jgi:hypothetical protein
MGLSGTDLLELPRKNIQGLFLGINFRESPSKIYVLASKMVHFSDLGGAYLGLVYFQYQHVLTIQLYGPFDTVEAMLILKISII